MVEVRAKKQRGGSWLLVSPMPTCTPTLGGWFWQCFQEFRLDEGVDITSYYGGYRVVTTKSGEYLRYSVDVRHDGTTLHARQRVLRVYLAVHRFTFHTCLDEQPYTSIFIALRRRHYDAHQVLVATSR